MTGSLAVLGVSANWLFFLYCLTGNDWKMSEKQRIVVACATFIGITSLIAGCMTLVNTETTWVRMIGAFMALQPLLASMCALVVISRNEIKETLND